MKPPRTKPALFFRLIIPVTVVFIMTILAMIASLFGDPRAPVSQWLEANGNGLLLWEFVVVVAISLLAMVVDRIRTKRGLDEELISDNRPSSSPDGNTV
ncbi:MAG: hypothetical protein KDA81_04390 [Planctomycetaceae bacterium]|nr:hypothetical protein [Planctomycetaceae bacterium]